MDTILYQLNVLNDHINSFTNVLFYIFSTDIFPVNREGDSSYAALQTGTNVIFGLVNKAEYREKLGIMVTPALYFFNEEGKLTAKLKGETTFERIRKEVNKKLKGQSETPF